jgi:hypothetical protein
MGFPGPPGINGVDGVKGEQGEYISENFFLAFNIDEKGYRCEK